MSKRATNSNKENTQSTPNAPGHIKPISIADTQFSKQDEVTCKVPGSTSSITVRPIVKPKTKETAHSLEQQEEQQVGITQQHSTSNKSHKERREAANSHPKLRPA